MIIIVCSGSRHEKNSAILAEAGHEQTANIAFILKDFNVPVTIVSSPAQYVLQSARLIAAVLQQPESGIVKSKHIFIDDNEQPDYDMALQVIDACHSSPDEVVLVLSHPEVVSHLTHTYARRYGHNIEIAGDPYQGSGWLINEEGVSLFPSGS